MDNIEYFIKLNNNPDDVKGKTMTFKECGDVKKYDAAKGASDFFTGKWAGSNQRLGNRFSKSLYNSFYGKFLPANGEYEVCCDAGDQTAQCNDSKQSGVGKYRRARYKASPEACCEKNLKANPPGAMGKVIGDFTCDPVFRNGANSTCSTILLRKYCKNFNFNDVKCRETIAKIYEFRKTPIASLDNKIKEFCDARLKNFFNEKSQINKYELCCKFTKDPEKCKKSKYYSLVDPKKKSVFDKCKKIVSDFKKNYVGQEICYCQNNIIPNDIRLQANSLDNVNINIQTETGRDRLLTANNFCKSEFTIGNKKILHPIMVHKKQHKIASKKACINQIGSVRMRGQNNKLSIVMKCGEKEGDTKKVQLQN